MNVQSAEHLRPSKGQSRSLHERQLALKCVFNSQLSNFVSTPAVATRHCAILFSMRRPTLTKFYNHYINSQKVYADVSDGRVKLQKWQQLGEVNPQSSWLVPFSFFYGYKNQLDIYFFHFWLREWELS